MSLVVCPTCKLNTLITNGRCQYCGNILKLGIWRRKMRRREAYGILLVAIGFAVIAWVKALGILALLTGFSLIAYGFFRPRVSL